MRELARGGDLSYEASIRVALEGAGIATVFERPYAARAPAVWRCFVVHDRDYERAAALVANLQRTPLIEPTDRRFQLARVCALILLVIALAMALWIYVARR